MKSIIKILILVAFLFAANTLQAQFTIPENAALSANPLYPSPGETFQVIAQAPAFNKNSSNFSWIINGRVRSDLSGIGKNTISLTAGEVGSVIKILVNITAPDGRNASARLIVVPAELVLHWIAETYTPKWYEGKALPVQNSVVKIIALPRIVIGGVLQSPNNLIYHWSLDDQKEALVGKGEKIFRIITSDLPKITHTVSVTVEDLNQKIVKKGKILITNREPKANIYHTNPLGGIDPRSTVQLFTTSERGLLDFQIEPFFFPVLSRNNLKFLWQVAGLEVEGSPENPYILTLDTKQQNASVIPISVEIDDQEPLIPSVLKTMTLILK